MPQTDVGAWEKDHPGWNEAELPNESSAYIENRRVTTTKEIAAANGDFNTLKAMLTRRKALAKIYREDGAVHTARIIETVDIDLIEAEIAKFY